MLLPPRVHTHTQDVRTDTTHDTLPGSTTAFRLALKSEGFRFAAGSRGGRARVVVFQRHVFQRSDS